MSFDEGGGEDCVDEIPDECDEIGVAGSRPKRHRYSADQSVGQFCGSSGLESAQSVAVIVGSASKITREQTDIIDAVLRAAVVPILEENGVTVVDGGTDAGVMRLLGHAIADTSHRTTLIGVAPADLVPSSPSVGQARAEKNHDHLVLTDGAEWNDELEVLGDVAEHLAGPRQPTMLVIGGGEGTKKEVDLARRMGWPIIVINGTGGTANEVAADGVGDDQLKVVGVSDHIELRKQLRWRLDPNQLLRRIWLETTNLDASSRRPKFGGLRTFVLLLGLGIVALALSIGLYGDRWPADLEGALRLLLAILPAAAAALMAWASRRRRDDRWIAPRAATNAALGEIFRYRARTGKYNSLETSSDGGQTPEQLLAARWGAILGQVGHSASTTTPPAVVPLFAPELDPADPKDELLGRISGCQYETVRVDHQLNYFPTRIATDDGRTTFLVALIYGMAVVGTLLASIDGAVAWVAVTASAATAVAAWLEYDRTEHRARQMKSTVTLIESSRGRWLANPIELRETAHAVKDFVADCEDVFLDENREWERAVNEASRSFAQHAVG